MPKDTPDGHGSPDLFAGLPRISRRMRENTKITVGIAAAVVIAVWVATIHSVSSERRERHALDRLYATELVSVLDAHVTGLLDNADAYLKAARREFQRNGSLADLREFLREAPLNPANVSHITVIDASGKPIFISTDDPLKPNVTAVDRDYFKAMKAGSGDPIFVSRSAVGRNSGLLLIRLARRVELTPGEFGGVIFAAIRADNLAEPFQALNLGPNSAVGVVGLDRQIRTWTESGRNQTDLNATIWPHWPTLEQSKSGTISLISPVDGIARALAYQRLDGYPLLAMIGVAGIDATAATDTFALSALLVALLVTLITLLLVTSVWRDVRVMRVLETEVAVRRRAEAEAMRATEVKTSFLATMSHEIRTPINAILGLFELIEQADVPERQKRQARAGQESANNLFKQLTNVLDASRLEAKSLDLTRRHEPVAPMIASLGQLLEAAVQRSGKTIATSIRIAAGVPQTLCIDRRRVEQIVLNFIDNAVKYTESGQIDLKVSTVESGSRMQVRFCVEDTGPGLSRADQTRLFQRFTQIDSAITRRVGGAGLGLSICKDLAELMQARLEVDSLPGQGARFSLIL